jgi:hypothetical protein
MKKPARGGSEKFKVKARSNRRREEVALGRCDVGIVGECQQRMSIRRRRHFAAAVWTYVDDPGQAEVET